MDLTMRVHELISNTQYKSNLKLIMGEGNQFPNQSSILHFIKLNTDFCVRFAMCIHGRFNWLASQYVGLIEKIKIYFLRDTQIFSLNSFHLDTKKCIKILESLRRPRNALITKSSPLFPYPLAQCRRVSSLLCRLKIVSLEKDDPAARNSKYFLYLACRLSCLALTPRVRPLMFF